MSENQEYDPSGDEERKIGEELVDDKSMLGTTLAHVYRGEIALAATWRRRLDTTTTWAVTVMAAILTWAFSDPTNPHYIMFIGIIIVTIFWFVESRRYRSYDVYRSRVRFIQENLYADALDPTREVKDRDWRVKLSSDFRRPTLKVSFFEALSRRLRRVYMALLSVLFAAWVFRILFLTPGGDWFPGVDYIYLSEYVVVSLIGLVYIGLLCFAFWPQRRHAKGEFREGDPREWKNVAGVD